MIRIWGVDGIPEITAGDDLAAVIASRKPGLRDGDIVVVTSKVVSKSEGRLVAGDTRDAAIDAETVRVVARRGDLRIVETRHGLVLAAAGVDASNVPAGTVALLPVDPDASAARLRAGLHDRLGIDVGVLVTDTMGRPWRNGLVDVAIGASGVVVLDDHRGRVDDHGHTLEMTVTALADEVAAAAELVKGKLDKVPVAVVRGLGHLVGGDSAGRAADLVRPPDEDLFRWGAREAVQAALNTARLRAQGTLEGAPDEVVDAAIAAVHSDGVVLVPVSSGDSRVGHVLACVQRGEVIDEAQVLSVGRVAERFALWVVTEGWSAVVTSSATGTAPAGLVAVATIQMSKLAE
ncbi:MAG: dehydro coenzyme reductase / coenzyme F420-0:L-glutamate ligase / coenzyme [Frankiaceae bacterium]|nr:dehydro coenzyme reductase / coenzyme F420-0:L-glutamate ligase / coenzyme [Frankiaceae bacterium]